MKMKLLTRLAAAGVALAACQAAHAQAVRLDFLLHLTSSKATYTTPGPYGVEVEIPAEDAGIALTGYAVLADFQPGYYYPTSPPTLFTVNFSGGTFGIAGMRMDAPDMSGGISNIVHTTIAYVFAKQAWTDGDIWAEEKINISFGQGYGQTAGIDDLTTFVETVLRAASAQPASLEFQRSYGYAGNNGFIRNVYRYDAEILSVQSIPEPGSLALALLGLAAVGTAARARSRTAAA